MSKRKDVSLVLFCDHCFHPNPISQNVESILYLLSFYRCKHCDYQHHAMQSLVNYSKETREYQ